MSKNLYTVNSFKSLIKDHLEQLSTKCSSAELDRQASEAKKLNSESSALPTVDTITVYKLEGCPYSIEAGTAVDRLPNGRSFYINEDLKVGKEAIKTILAANTKLKPDETTTFPIVFMGLEPIGGNAELQQRLAHTQQRAGGKRRRMIKVGKKPKRASRKKRSAHKAKNK